MTKDQFNKSIESGELQLKANTRFTHFSIVVFLVLGVICILAIHLFYYLQGKGFYLEEREIWAVTVPAVLALLLYWLQKSRLKFKVIPTNLTWPEIVAVIDQVSKELEWIPVHKQNGAFVAITDPGVWLGSWGERITILLDDDRLFINSICNPNKRQSITSMGRNRKNVNALIKYVKNAEGKKD
jgi:hypothetical protein